MLLLPLLTLASAADLAVSPRLPAVLPCDDGAWTLRFSRDVTVAALTEGAAPLTCDDITCQPALDGPPPSLTLSTERPDTAYAAMRLDCPGERHGLAIGLLPPPDSGAAAGPVSGRFPLPAGPVCGELCGEAVRRIPRSDAPSESDGAALIEAMLAYGVNALAVCAGSGVCPPAVVEHLPAPVSAAALTRQSTGRGPTDWHPSESRAPHVDSWVATYTDGERTYELANALWDSVTETLALRVLDASRPTALLTLGGLHEDFVSVRWEGGHVSLIDERDRGRELRAHGDAVLLAPPGLR